MVEEHPTADTEATQIIGDNLPCDHDAARPAARHKRSIRLSVLVVTYNHESYIKQALESVLWQDIECEFEIVIADDCSTDNTREVAADFLKEGGFENFRFLDFSHNRGITKNYERALFSTNTEYIAVIEGDDVWTRTDKLRILIDYLHSHRECVAASANYIVNVVDRHQFYPRTQVNDAWSYIDARLLINDNVIGNFSTVVYRSRTLRLLPKKLFDGRTYDWLLHICLLKHGLIGFYNEPLSLYRVHAGGSWSGMTRAEQIKSQLAELQRCDEITGRVFTSEFEELTRRLRQELYAHADKN